MPNVIFLHDLLVYRYPSCYFRCSMPYNMVNNLEAFTGFKLQDSQERNL